MSLLNRPSNGFHSSLVVIYKLLLEKQKITKEKIEALCAPESVVQGDTRKYVLQTLNTWIKLGLFVVANDEVVIDKDIVKDYPTPESLPSAARLFALKKENNENFFEKEEAGSSDFTRLLAWSLMQDVWAWEQTSHSEVQQHLQKQTQEGDIFLQNDTRWGGFKAWAPFLGFGWTPRYPRSKFEPDPTVAIRDILPNTFSSSQTLDAPDFVRKLATDIPVLDGGEYRLMVEKRLGESEGEYSWQPLPDGQLSTSLSRALMRFEEDGSLHFENKDDSEHRRLLTGRSRQVIKSFTHVTWKGVQA